MKIINTISNLFNELNCSSMEYFTMPEAALIINKLCDSDITEDNIEGFLEEKSIVSFDSTKQTRSVSGYTSNNLALLNCSDCNVPYLLTHRCLFFLIENLIEVKECISKETALGTYMMDRAKGKY